MSFLSLIDSSYATSLFSLLTRLSKRTKGTGSAVWVLMATGVGWSGKSSIRYSCKGFHAVHHIAYDQFVEVLYSLELMLIIAGMSGLVRRLDVQIDKINFFQRLYRCIGLSFIIRINPAGDPGTFRISKPAYIPSPFVRSTAETRAPLIAYFS